MGARQKATFKLTIMTPDALIYQKEVESVFFTGDRGEYELLPYHYPVLGILKEGHIIINWHEAVPIKFGLLRFFANDCIVLIEEKERLRPSQGKKKDEMAIEDEDAVHH
jgi:F0F1-type ATP synthase epsilon subunit